MYSSQPFQRSHFYPMDSNLNGKSLSKQFCPAIQLSTQPNRNETDYVKSYFTPLPMTYEGMVRNHSTVLQAAIP